MPTEFFLGASSPSIKETTEAVIKASGLAELFKDLPAKLGKMHNQCESANEFFGNQDEFQIEFSNERKSVRLNYRAIDKEGKHNGVHVSMLLRFNTKMTGLVSYNIDWKRHEEDSAITISGRRHDIDHSDLLIGICGRNADDEFEKLINEKLNRKTIYMYPRNIVEVYAAFVAHEYACNYGEDPDEKRRCVGKAGRS